MCLFCVGCGGGWESYSEQDTGKWWWDSKWEGVTDFTTKVCCLLCILRDPIRAAAFPTFYLPRWNRDLTPSAEGWLSQLPSQEATLWKKRAFVCILLTMSNQSGKKKSCKTCSDFSHNSKTRLFLCRTPSVWCATSWENSMVYFIWLLPLFRKHAAKPQTQRESLWWHHGYSKITKKTIIQLK